MRFPNSFAFFFVSFNFFSWVWGTILKTLDYEFLNSVHSISTLCNVSCLSCNNRRQTECKMSLSLRFVFLILKVITNACILCYLLNSNVFFPAFINKSQQIVSTSMDPMVPLTENNEILWFMHSEVGVPNPIILRTKL